jgi:hypothetical protein
MQREDIEQHEDATTHASTSYDKPMKDKHDDARRMAEQLVAEETHRSPNSAIRTYFVAAVIGLVIWAVIYFVWRSL